MFRDQFLLYIVELEYIQHSVDDTRLAVKQWNIEQIRAGTRETPTSRAVLMILWALDWIVVSVNAEITKFGHDFDMFLKTKNHHFTYAFKIHAQE